MPQIPKHLQGILWSVDANKLDLNRDATYIIHQILSYGRAEEIKWLFNNYPKPKITHTFLNRPYKDYRASRFHFVKNYLLDLKNQTLNMRHYVKNIPRDLG